MLTVTKQTLTLDEHEVREALVLAAHKKRPDLFPEGSQVSLRVTCGESFLQATVWQTSPPPQQP